MGARDRRFTRDGSGMEGVAGAHDLFGFALTTGDFDNDQRQDLAMGNFRHTPPGSVNCGAVNVVYGSSSGLVVADNQYFHQNSPGLVGSCEDNDFYAATLASGDLNGDGTTDLVIGAPGEEISGLQGAGAVYVLPGNNPNGLSNIGDFQMQE